MGPTRTPRHLDFWRGLSTGMTASDSHQSPWVGVVWQAVTEGLSAKLVVAEGGKEWLILCRSAARRAKEQATLARFVGRIEAGL